MTTNELIDDIDPDDKVVCVYCIGNEHLKELVTTTSVGTEELPCSYCDRIDIVINLPDLADLFDSEFQRNYEVADNSLRDDHGYPPLGNDLSEIVEKEIKPESEDLVSDLCEMILARWEQQHGFDGVPVADDSCMFVNVGANDFWIRNQWRDMRDSLLSQARFVNPDALEVLKSVFDGVDGYTTKFGTPLIVEAGPECELNTLFRARVFQSDEALETALDDPESSLGPPPPKVSNAGRMNAKGVSVFYGANLLDTAVAEVRPPVGSRVAVAQFRILRKLRLLDLTRFKDISPVIADSMFDHASLEKARRQRFISRLETELVKPVMPESSDDGYLVTQVVSDYLATHKQLNLDGVIFRSIQVSEHEDRRALNIVLFHKATTLKRSFAVTGRKLRAHLFVMMDDGDDWFRPEISYTEDPVQLEENEKWDFLEVRDPSLELIPESIVVCEIKCVSFEKHESSVGLVKMRNDYPHDREE